MRWGRRKCPADATQLYVGVAAGSHYADTGSGHNFVCLHPNPTYQEWDARVNAESARLYRAEYETTTMGLADFWRLQNQDVPCAVCQAGGSMATQMQPGSTKCPTMVGKLWAGCLKKSKNPKTRQKQY